MRVAIRAHHLIDGTGAPPVANAMVLIEDDLIKAAGDRSRIDVPEGAQVIDLEDRTLLPGFVDAHTHISLIPALGNQSGQKREPLINQMFRCMSNVRKILCSGVTTARVMGEEYFLDVEFRKAIEAGRIPGPRLIIATRALTPTNGHGAALTVTDGPDAIRKRARENLREGADFLKMFATGGMSSRVGVNQTLYSDSEVAVIVEEAKRAGTYVAAHAHGGEGLRQCLRLGVHTIEHAGLITAEDLERVIEKGAWLVGTFAILYHPEGIEGGDFHIHEIREKVLQGREVVRGNWRRVVRSEAKWALGSDAIHGHFPCEARFAVEFGASPMDAIEAMTRRSAEVCGVSGKVGTIEAGKMADIVAVPGNPLEDIRALEQVDFIMKGGRRYDHLSVE